MSRCLQFWTGFSQSRTTCYDVVRHASRKVWKKVHVPNHATFIEEESAIIFGPSRNSDGKPVKQKKKEKRLSNRDNADDKKVIHKVHIKSSVDTTPHQTDVTSAQPTDISGSQRPSLARELDSILTFPIGKTVFEVSKELVPSVNTQTDIPILNSDEVTSLDKTLSLPSVSKILEKSRPPEEQAMLDRWKAKMIGELGEEGFALWQKETFARGHNLHACIQKQLETGDGDSNLNEKNVPFWQSIQHVFHDVSDVHLIEKYCKHPHLRYHGYFDCVARFRDKLCLIEWKTSKRQKATIDSTFDNPLQVAAYMGAVNFDQQYDLNVDDGLIVIAYENGQPADVHPLTRDQSRHYWGSWLHRLYTYWKLTLQEQEELKRAIVTA